MKIIRVLFLALCFGTVTSTHLYAQALPLPAAVPTGEVSQADVNNPEAAGDNVRSLARIAARLDAFTDDALRNWLPLRSEEAAKKFWGSSDALQFLPQLKFFAAEDRRTVATDIVVSYIGPTRHAFGFSLTQGEDNGTTEQAQDAQDNLEKVMAAGGDAYLTIAYPLLCAPKCPYAKSKTEGDTVTVTEPIATFTVVAAPRFAALIPSLGRSSSEFQGNADIAVEAVFTLGRSDADIQYVFQARQGFILAAEDFAKELAITDAQNNYVGTFGFGQWSTGIRIKGLFLIAVQGITNAPQSFRDRIPIRLVTQIIPAFK